MNPLAAYMESRVLKENNNKNPNNNNTDKNGK